MTLHLRSLAAFLRDVVRSFVAREPELQPELQPEPIAEDTADREWHQATCAMGELLADLRAEFTEYDLEDWSNECHDLEPLARELGAS